MPSLCGESELSETHKYSSQVWCWLTAEFDFTIKLPYFGVESVHDEEQMSLAVSSVGATDATALRVRLLEAMRQCSNTLKHHMEAALVGAEPTIYIDHVHFLGASANIAYVAVVREPLRWISSHFYFHRDSEMPLGLAGCNETHDGQPLSLVEAVRIAGSDDTSPCADRTRRYLSWFAELGSAQTRILCGIEPDCFDYTPGQEDDRPERQSLALALEHLVNDYAVVGVLEKWRLTLRVLEAQLPHFFCGAVDYAATRSSDDKYFSSQPGDFASRPLDESFPPDVDQTVRRWLANDFVLYATADARLEQLAGRYVGRRLEDDREMGVK